ncbi:MAG TPA: hydantoinase/oxoprolinase family protein, partial [Acidimicrobiia bacterium]|nr:hydantoinase/oxoprolinase family protein [Acidimicrobiia bacterium]
VMRSIEASGVDPAAVVALAHGTTVATNALLERRGVLTALVTTQGFRDVLEIGRQNRPSLYDLTEDRPPALVPRHLRFTVRERMGPTGPIVPLDDGDLARVVADISRSGAEAVAVCLLFSFLHPEHEEQVGAALRAALPCVHVSLSSEVLPEFREYERFSTTTADAYLSPRLSAYLNALAGKVAAAGIPQPVVMQSSGGVTEIADAASRAASCVLSGPAGGVVGAAFVAQAAGFADFLTFDMGGTSTDVAPVIGGSLQITTESVVAGVPIKNPMVDVHTVSAGGGSVAWVDEGGALRVGPRSAGADPGPAAYGCGGTEPTVTDANLWLGYLADGARLGGELVLKRELSDSALQAVAARIGLSVADTALGVVAVANAEMARALRVISVERGLDPRDFALVAFGGAGPLHACALAEDLGMSKVLVPKSSGVLSALGLAISDLQRDYVRPWLAPLDGADGAELDEAFAAMESRAAGDLSSPEFRRRADLRYAGQSFELTVDADDAGFLAEAFHAAHERRYGYRMEEQPLELVNLRLVATVPGTRPTLVEDAPSHQQVESGLRQANFDGAWRDVAVHDRTRMGSGSKVEGPAIVDFPEATCVVRPEWRGVIDETGTLVLERA